MSTNYDHPHRCETCALADEMKNYVAGSRYFKCSKTGAIVEGTRIPECYGCRYYEEVKE